LACAIIAVNSLFLLHCPLYYSSDLDLAGPVMIRWRRRSKQKIPFPKPPCSEDLWAKGSPTMFKGVVTPNITFLIRYMIYEELGLKGCKIAGWLQAFTCSARE
jgi:hypothetical protein